MHRPCNGPSPTPDAMRNAAFTVEPDVGGRFPRLRRGLTDSALQAEKHRTNSFTGSPYGTRLARVEIISKSQTHPCQPGTSPRDLSDTRSSRHTSVPAFAA